jgi:hypothetical protein
MDETVRNKGGRPKKTRVNPDELRKKIKASWIIGRLQAHIEGKIALTITQVKACDVLLRKIVPDVQTQHVVGELTHNFVIEVPPMLSREEWLARYSPSKQIEHQPANGGGNGKAAE